MKAQLMDLPLFRDYLITKKFLAESTVAVYTDAISMFLAQDPDLIVLEDYNNFIIKMSIKKRCYHFFYAIKNFIEYKIEENSLKNKLIEGLIKPEMRQDIVQERRYLSEEDIISVINSLEKDMENIDKTSFCKTKPEAFVERFCSKLNINNELTRVCQFVAMKLENDNVMPENTPHSIAAGVVYFISQICKLNVSKKDVKNVSEISEVTINKCFKKLEKMTDDLIPAVILKKYATIHL